MRKIALLLASVSLAGAAAAQQQTHFNVGDAVDYNTSGRWTSCVVTAQPTAAAYLLHCGTVELRAKSDSDQLRRHIVAINLLAQPVVTTQVALPLAPLSLGARYGTRDPRTCDRTASTLTQSQARDLLICDAEREFGGNLFLVANVSIDIVQPRKLTARELSGTPDIDRTKPFYDIRASYQKFQCTPLPLDRDNPNAHNCNQFKVTSAPGGCYKNTLGEWHCVTFDLDTTMAATATGVKPPTLTD